MKKIRNLLLIVIGTLILVFGSFILYQHLNVKDISIHGSYDLYSDIDELSNSDRVRVILLVEKLEKSENYVFGDILNQFGYTLSEVKVKEILLDKHKSKIKKGETITIEEPFYVNTHPIMGKAIVRYGNYTPMLNHSHYVVFLNWSERSNSYTITGLEQGKYNIDDKDKKELEQYEYNMNDLRKEIRTIYKEAIEKYNKKN